MSHFNTIIENRWHQKLELDLISWCQLKSILPSIRALVYPEIFWELDHYFFLSFCMVLETHGKLCLTELDIFGKKVFAPKIGKMGLKYAKNSFFGFIEKCGHQSFLNLFYNENQYYLLCSCTNSIFGKNLVPEMWVKMLPANLIAGLLNQFYLQDKPMK